MKNFLPKTISDRQKERATYFMVEMVKKNFPLPFGTFEFKNSQIQLPCVVAVDLDNGWTFAFSQEGIVVVTWAEICDILKSQGLPIVGPPQLQDLTAKATQRMREGDPFEDAKTPWQRKMRLREMLETYVGKATR